ncbi:transmembrane prolyl 4-hydroxylase-like [Pocillopora damicornis]|uniref:transmembrane prolyl 4-hydroxylase-like n=1 Tax=Pocillopora damicornis TaxID=46731 RepID=UPI000F555D41|nr:transmembrane prolyl 4-hydroxylase-like [Pocillopora damicornis]
MMHLLSIVSIALLQWSFVIFAFADGQSSCCQGPPGQPGTPGTPGIPGNPGTPGTSAYCGCGQSGAGNSRRWKQCAWVHDNTKDGRDNGKVHAIVLQTIVIFLAASNSAGVNHLDDVHGPCVVRRTKLPRLDPVEVGFVRQIGLIKEQPPFTVKTLSVRPPIFEIPAFLSEAEINRVLAMAEHGRQENSDVFHNSMDSLPTQTSFDHWDLNRDDLINSDEVIAGMRYFWDLHFTTKDVKRMLTTLNISKVNPGRIHRSEFLPADIMKYVKQVGNLEPKVKGRHSNQTYIEFAEDDQISTTLNKKKAALTGLPVEIIKDSETPVAVRYGPGGHYHCHYDSHPLHAEATCCHRRSLDKCRICRFITILYFLNDVAEGGQTAFPIADSDTFNQQTWMRKSNYLSNLSAYCSKANLRVTPKRGSAIMWYNHVTNKTSGWISSLDLRSYHGGCDVIRGHKWIVNNWINIIGGNWDDLRTWNDKNSRTK